MEGLPKPGERIIATVKTLNGEANHEGLVLPSPAPRHISIKLDNGYNVNYPQENIISWEYAPSAQTGPSPTLNAPAASSDLPKVRLIHTGGTIA